MLGVSPPCLPASARFARRKYGRRRNTGGKYGTHQKPADASGRMVRTATRNPQAATGTYQHATHEPQPPGSTYESMNSAARRGRFSGGPAVGVQQFDGLRSARPTIGKPCEPDWEAAAGRGCAPRAWPNGGGGFCEAPPPPGYGGGCCEGPSPPPYGGRGCCCDARAWPDMYGGSDPNWE